MEKKEESSSTCLSYFKDKEFLKGLSTVIGAIFVNLIAGSIFPLNSLAVYEISYIRHVDPESTITVDNLIFYYPFEIFFQCLSSFACGIIEKKIGLYYTNFLGFSIYGLGYFTMYLSRSFAADILSMILCGIGNGIIYYPSTKNACMWFPNHMGIVMGIMETMISIGSFIFSVMGEHVINREAIESNEEQIYDKEISLRMKTYLIIQIACLIGVYIISSLMTFIPRVKPEEVEKLIQDDSHKINDINSSNESNESNKKDYKKMIIHALKSKRMILYIFLSICFHQAPNMQFSLFRVVGEYENIDQDVLQWINSINFIFECLSGIIVGVLCDYMNLRILMGIITLSMSVLIFTYCLSFSSSIAFFFSTNLITFINGGIYPFDDCYMMKVFGPDIYIELMGINTCITNTVVLSLTPLSYYVESTVENKHQAFWILFSSFGVTSVIAFVLGLFINPSPFNYEERFNLSAKKIKDGSEGINVELAEKDSSTN